jgi:hypothetical protein
VQARRTVRKVRSLGVICLLCVVRGGLSSSRMETNEFVEKLLSQVSLEAIDFASDVERLLAEQILFLRGELETCRQEAVLGAHAVIRELYARLSDKNAQIETLRDEVRFLRAQVAAEAG